MARCAHASRHACEGGCVEHAGWRAANQHHPLVGHAPACPPCRQTQTVLPGWLPCWRAPRRRPPLTGAACREGGKGLEEVRGQWLGEAAAGKEQGGAARGVHGRRRQSLALQHAARAGPTQRTHRHAFTHRHTLPKRLKCKAKKMCPCGRPPSPGKGLGTPQTQKRMGRPWGQRAGL